MANDRHRLRKYLRKKRHAKASATESKLSHLRVLPPPSAIALATRSTIDVSLILPEGALAGYPDWFP